MTKSFKRTLTYSEVTITDVSTNKVIETDTILGKTTAKKVAKSFMKKHDDYIPVKIDIKEVLVQREITLDDFLKYSKICEDTENKEDEK